MNNIAETITLAELRETELYRKEQTRSLREFLEPKKLTDEEIQELSDFDYCNPDGVFDHYLFARLIEATVQGVDLEETSFQTVLSKKMKGKAQE